MIRRCMDCRAEMGEKCPQCGSVVLQPIPRRVIGAIVAAFLHCSFSDLFSGWVRCSVCELEFTVGEGGETTGLCDHCKVRRFRDVEILKAEARKSGLVGSAEVIEVAEEHDLQFDYPKGVGGPRTPYLGKLRGWQ